MTKKPLNPLEDPPTASSSDDDEVETSAEEEDSSSEEDEPKNPIKAPSAAATVAVPAKNTVASAAAKVAVPAKNTVASAPAAAKQGSDSDSGSENETGSDSETERPPNPPPKQGSGNAVALTAPAAAVKAKKLEAAQTSVKSGTKRPSEGTSRDGKAKQAKKVTSGDDEKKKSGEETKKPAFQRLWSEEDEISVLQGMIDFKADTGKSPYEDSNGFYDFIKKSISFEVSKSQCMDKIRGLKKKYIGKEKPSFKKPHEKKAFKLCKYIWGPEGMALETAIKSNGVTKKSQKTKKLDSVKQDLAFATSPNGKKAEEDKKVESSVAVMKSDWFETSFLVRSIAGLGVDEQFVKERWSLVPVETKKKVEENLKALQAKEFDYLVQKAKFLHELTSMISEASKNKPCDT